MTGPSKPPGTTMNPEDEALITLGKATGLMRKAEVFDAVVAAVHTGQLRPNYLSVLRDLLDSALCLALPGFADGSGQVCRICGCTDGDPCDGGCTWVERGLCSACAPKGGR